MIQTIQSKLNIRRGYTQTAATKFIAAFPKVNKDLDVFYFDKYIWTNLMVSKSLDDFIKNCLIDQMENETKQNLGFSEEFDYVLHCVECAKIFVGKKDTALKAYSYIHAVPAIVQYMKIKYLKEILDSNKD